METIDFEAWAGLVEATPEAAPPAVAAETPRPGRRRRTILRHGAPRRSIVRRRRH